MSTRVNTGFVDELKKYGEVKVDDCFNCGTCTAVCPLSEGQTAFPRKMVRYAQMGMEDDLLSSKELWLCYYCGECTTTCPREADPGEFMAASRRYAIAKYDEFGLAKMLFTKPILSTIFLVVFAVLIGLFFLGFAGEMSMEELKLFEFVPTDFIHNLGVATGVLVMVALVWNTFNMAKHVRKALPYPEGTKFNWFKALWNTGIKEVLAQKRYREDCEKDKPLFSQKWFIHASVLWGFLGLMGATAANFLLETFHIKPTGTWMPIYHPIRLLGTVAGILLVYGTTAMIARRLRKEDPAYAHSTPSDWAFLILMWLSGVTGFILEIVVYLPTVSAWNYWALIAHLMVVGEMLLLIPFTKFAHALYRSIALYMHALEPLPEKEVESAPAAGL